MFHPHRAGVTGATTGEVREDRPRMTSSRGRRCHRESLLAIPLLEQMLRDPGFTIVRRGIDARWTYKGLISTRIDGFNPLRCAAFVGSHSHFERWRPHRHESARRFNPGDELVPEALFVVHDYLHAWTYHWIAELCPRVGFGQAPITSDNFEDMVFCHLLSEAVATVGLDYWYLSTVELNQEVPIGTMQRSLTASYREELAEEYARFNPKLNVQHPSFLQELARFYCDGVFRGFSALDFLVSPAIDAWLTHELRYGKLQRQYCREWFAYLSGGEVKLSEEQSAAPVGCEASWQKKLMVQLGERLWAKVKSNELCAADNGFDPETAWSAPADAQPDFRFINFNRQRNISPASVKEMSEESFEYLMRQYIARFDYGAFPKEALGVFNLIREERDFSIGRRLLKGVKRLPVGRTEPRDIFLYN